MFRKIVSNLSLSPTAGSQLTYYLKRLQKEGVTRKLSMVFAVGLVVLQIATIVSPTHASNVPSPNDIVYGGLGATPLATQLRAYDQNNDGYPGHINFQDLYTRFGITRPEIAAATVGSINSGDHSLLSLGREHQHVEDQLYVVAGTNYYLKPLFVWGDNLTYPALLGTRADGSFFALMIDCGNVVVRTVPPVVTPPKPTPKPVPPPPKPLPPAVLTLNKNVSTGYPAAGSHVPPGTELGFKLSYSNIGASPANSVTLADPIPEHTALVQQGDGTPVFDQKGHDAGNVPTVGAVNHVWWIRTTLAAGGTGYVQFSVKVADNTPNNTQICNTAYIQSKEVATVKSAPPICYTVVVAAPKPPPPPPIVVTPVTPTPTPGTPNVAKSKTVSDLTTSVAGVTKTTASAGDTLEYKLVNKNTGTAAATNYLIYEDINDILAYADLVDTGGAVNQGGQLSWPLASIPAGGQVTEIFRVKVKDPVPVTPATQNDPKLFDLTLTNIYGNAVEVTLPAPPAKQVEVVTKELPQTGAGTSTTILFVVIAGMVYFYFRNRQLVKELKMLRVDNVVGQ